MAKDKSKPEDEKTNKPPAGGEGPAEPSADKPEEKPAEPKPSGFTQAKPKARVCDGNDRATTAGEGGLRRFKLRLDGHPTGARSQRYVLAADCADAEACYLAHEKVELTPEDRKAGVRVVVVELPD